MSYFEKNPPIAYSNHGSFQPDRDASATHRRFAPPPSFIADFQEARNRNVAGVALIMVIFIVALASLVVTNLTYSTFMESRVVGMVERQLQSEYLLKSMMHFSAGLVSLDTSPTVDGVQDPWGYFLDGRELPESLLQGLGIPSVGIRVSLQIRPQNMKMPLDGVYSKITIDKTLFKRYRDAIRDLFILLGMDDQYSEPDHTGQFGDRIFSATEMTANLIDYMDEDSDPYSEDGYAGVESEDLKAFFINQKLVSLEELTRIPGFTPGRVARMMPFVTITGDSRINVNVANRVVLEALHSDIDSTMASDIYNFVRSQGAVERISILTDNIPGFSNTIVSETGSILAVNSGRFEVIGKVESGNSVTYARAELIKGRRGLGEVPEIKNLQFY